ncbi:MAG: bifunctional UDP-N-acetylglucosamine diphosphorylase/glucosamine-1-phosphate N-acetyltransferase GlmU [bacterium]
MEQTQRKKLGVVVLAAGQGTRMKSDLPKVMHPVGGQSLLGHVLDTASSLDPQLTAVVYGHGGEQVKTMHESATVTWVEQAEQLGTGHAVQQAAELIAEVDQVLVLYGDVPLLRAETLQQLLNAAGDEVGLLTVTLPDPFGYGRIVRDGLQQVACIVEQKDASEAHQKICEVNTGIMVLPATKLGEWLQRLSNDNAQGEYYLTDVVAMAVEDDVAIHTAQPAEAIEAEGINDRVQLARMERVWQQRQAQQAMLNGVTLRDPARFDIRGNFQTGKDVEIDINVLIEGNVTLGSNVRIGANTVLRDVIIADGTVVNPNCIIEQATIGENCLVGPFARIRPGASLDNQVHVGNFVEIKNSHVADGAKVNHLSYVGDSEIGKAVNVGAGTITCNYDGVNKHRTVIGDNAFIGSNTALVAPITVGEGATIAAGSVITRPAPEGKLTLTRPRQMTIDSWQRPKKDN